MRHVCGLDVHKDSVFVCILNERGVVFQEKFGALTPSPEALSASLAFGSPRQHSPPSRIHGSPHGRKGRRHPCLGRRCARTYDRSSCR